MIFGLGIAGGEGMKVQWSTSYGECAGLVVFCDELASFHLETLRSLSCPASQDEGLRHEDNPELSNCQTRELRDGPDEEWEGHLQGYPSKAMIDRRGRSRAPKADLLAGLKGISGHHRP